MKCILKECSISSHDLVKKKSLVVFNIKTWKENQDTAKQCSTFTYISMQSHNGDLKEYVPP